MTLKTASVTTSSAEVRSRLVEALRLDLVGPCPDEAAHQAYEREILPQTPSQWYLTGFLVPSDTKLPYKSDPDADETLDLLDEIGGGDDENEPEPASASKGIFPSSMGLSILVSAETTTLEAIVRWGDYRKLPAEESQDGRRSRRWQREPRQAQLSLALPRAMGSRSVPVPGSDGLELVVVERAVSVEHLPKGTRSVSVFLVNRRVPQPDTRRDEGVVFQPELILRSGHPLVARPDPRGRGTRDSDEQVADLQYRDAVEHVVGHNVSAVATCEQGVCREVRTSWMPTAEVEKVVPNERIPGVELGLEALAAAASYPEIERMIEPMLEAYGTWIKDQSSRAPAEPHRAEVAERLMQAARRALKRMRAGLEGMQDPLVLEAFRLANRAVARAIRQRECHGRDDRKPGELQPPRWRPFQLAFLLTNMAGVIDAESSDRRVVDLLFFPTGGGKTEAYLGLAAFTMLLRRLRDPSIQSAGVSVLMRYTLRLLTLDQLGRAATLVCALELERKSDVEKLGRWPFEIGLWVGQSATPNRMGRKGDKDQYSARSRTISFLNDPNRKPSPIPLENCPWCGTRFSKDSFQLLPDPNEPKDLRVMCVQRGCEFHSRKAAEGLPILAVDDPIYRRLPAFLIATVDKLANLPWVGQTAGLFGKVDRYAEDGFFGPWAAGEGRPLDRPLLPPDLIIQDELHLISGPLGTMVGLYETAVDALCTSGEAGGPKIVASTATVRRAEKQIRGLFGRTAVEVFPPPGPDRRDSFFAQTVPATEKHARLYVGIAAQGRNLKVALLRTMLALLGAAQTQWEFSGGARSQDNPADPYMTALTYFNALRELGGARRIVEDEVRTRAADYGRRRLREGEQTGLFADRRRFDEPRELTSRVSTNEVSETKRRLALPFRDAERVDVALATNMISVGLDITRLGLMLVLGQPKTAAEYIQATSRVGRDDRRPGLVVTLLNVHRHRDRSHYERFSTWHESFYRAVEAASVTPFSPRAIDRGLAGVTVALARLGLKEMTAPRQAVEAPRYRAQLDFVAETISRRAEAHDKDLSAEASETLRRQVKAKVLDLLDSWVIVAQRRGELQYQREVGTAPPLLYDPMDPELDRVFREARKFKAGRSLRDVEPTVNLWLEKTDESGAHDGR